VSLVIAQFSDDEEYLDGAKPGASLVAVRSSRAPGQQGPEDPARTPAAAHEVLRGQAVIVMS
jgi:hypothetical protein